MIIQKKQGSLSKAVNHKAIDWLVFHWYETNKRIQTKRTVAGKELTLKFLNGNPSLIQDDILFEDENSIIAVEVLPCDCMVIAPKNMYEMAAICYEIGNKHLPLFFENDELLVPFEMPLYKLLTAQGYEVKKEQRKLLNPLKTTVTPHGSSGETLFSRIMKLTAPNE